MTALQDILQSYREAASTQREAGTYFEELTVCYLKNEPAYAELYQDVMTYSRWAEQQGLDKRDAGIDLAAVTFDGEVHAIQCKNYAPDYRVQKADIDSFFTASGKHPFTHRLIVATTNLWSTHAEDALRGQRIPVNKIDLHALENSVIDWAKFAPRKRLVLREKKTLRKHQENALTKVKLGLAEHDRGKLIMACGTGKTFTSLKIAETLVGAGGRVLFLVPSLALLSQTLTEWTQESEIRLRSYAVCSDSDVGKKRSKESDAVQTFTHELQYPATTDARHLAKEVKLRHDAEHISVVFATYHSIDVVADAQNHGLDDFDLIICDEAHRTTGTKFEGEDDSHFVKVHDAGFIRGKKRLYMTATPRIYADSAKATAERDNVALCSMDDETLYGPNLCVLTFSEAVKRGLLVDYKVIVLSIEESHVSRRIQNLLKSENNELRVDDAAKIIGCWKALAKQGLTEDLGQDAQPMKRAVAFCQVIEQPKSAKTHKVASKAIASMFQAVVEAYQESASADEKETAAILHCEAEHVDGGMNATEKDEKISWLKATAPEDTCRILSNVRCLSEGVDVPALDAVLFLTPRSSQVDVVQSVGRVMRNAPGKNRGYIVLPVVIPAGMEPHEALNDNDTYKVVWQVLQALRSHDDRFDAMINKLDLVGKDPAKMEVIAITDKIGKKPSKKKGAEGKKAAARGKARGGQTIGTSIAGAPMGEQMAIEFEIGEIERAIYAKLVQKVGNRHHWEDWAKDIAQIARTHIDRITGIIENKANARERAAFDSFAEELRDDLNDSITREEIVEMLAQHLVTKPVFDALFAGHGFASENPMSRAMQGVLDVLQEHRLEKEAGPLRQFYESVRLRAEGINTPEGRQKVVVELYDKFFRNAFPKMSERLGIVYTPIEIVDFILKSVDHLLRSEFGQTLGSPGVHILDPFTGTGTFITRLLQSGLISKEELPNKYASEIHANEIVLLAYYIAAINIEAAYHGVVGGEYQPFEGICLTDTFQLYEKDDLISRVLVDNSSRRSRQKKLDIRVIIGNPPYSVGQKSENDNNENVNYPQLDQRISDTYAKRTSATNKNALYDSYIRAIRWASDRVGSSGIVGFVTNAGFVDATTASGLRQCLAEEFSSLYIFHLRGNQRTAGELSRREGGKVFGSGSRAPVAISLLVKNPRDSERGQIFYRDVGDYLTREEKLAAVGAFGSIAGVEDATGWTRITPDVHGDWLKQRDSGFSRHIALADKSGATQSVFVLNTPGIQSNRDAWVFGPSRSGVLAQITTFIEFYNSEVARLRSDIRVRSPEDVGDLVDNDPKKIKWTSGLKRRLVAGEELRFDSTRVVQSLYRPFTKEWLYFAPELLHRPGQTARLFPRQMTNRAIGVSGSESRAGYSVLMVDAPPSKDAIDVVGSQLFPLYTYNVEVTDDEDQDAPLLNAAATPRASNPGVPVRTDGITDAGLAHFRSAYPSEISESITKEDVFYYVYGILHSTEYRERYADNLGKELPRIPRVKRPDDFWAFSRTGRALGELHVGYERVPEYAAKIDGPAKPTGVQYHVEKMKFGKGKDKTVIQYNDFIVVREIPLEAYEYVVNGKSAIEWVMERQGVAVDKVSGITKDANDWATETVGDPRYPLSLLLRVITVSLETVRAVRSLPKLEILGDTSVGTGGEVLPFRRVEPTPGEQFRTCVPLVPLRAAAGAWSDIQEDLAEPGANSEDWVTWESSVSFTEDMFVAQVCGKSMEPTIPDGAYCLFRRVPAPSAPDRAVLVRHAGKTDPEHGGQFTVKLHRVENSPSGEARLVLRPANPEFAPLTFGASDADSVRVVAEVIEVLGG